MIDINEYSPHDNPTESQEQTMLFDLISWLLPKYPELKLMYHIPNGGSRHPAEARNLKYQGVKPGVPDICLPVARGRYHGLYIKMKRIKHSQTTKAQQQWIKDLKAQGYKAEICKGHEAAEKVIMEYLSL